MGSIPALISDMNIIDLALLLIALISIAFALYRGFLSSLLGFIACAVSLAAAFLISPYLTRILGANQGLNSLIATYTDAGSLVGDFALAHTPVYAMNEQTVDTMLKNISLPDEMRKILQTGLAAAARQGTADITVNSTVTHVIVSAMLGIGSFILCFFGCLIITHFLINMFGHVFPFPMLIHFDTPAAAILGLMRGVLVVSVLLLTVPLIRTVVPFDLVNRYLDQSMLIPMLSRNDIFMRIAVGGI